MARQKENHSVRTHSILLSSTRIQRNRKISPEGKSISKVESTTRYSDEGIDGADYALTFDCAVYASDGGWWNLHGEGAYSNGSWNLGTVVEQAARVAAYVETQGKWSESGAGQFNEGVSDTNSASTFNLYRQGSYSNGSWSFASLTLNYTAHAEGSADESGSNDEFSWYERSDAYEYDYSCTCLP